MALGRPRKPKMRPGGLALWCIDPGRPFQPPGSAPTRRSTHGQHDGQHAVNTTVNTRPKLVFSFKKGASAVKISIVLYMATDFKNVYGNIAKFKFLRKKCSWRYYLRAAPLAATPQNGSGVNGSNSDHFWVRMCCESSVARFRKEWAWKI